MQYEERNKLTQVQYTENDIYKWNIDGMIDHQILNLMHEMALAAIAYKIHQNTNHQAD